MNRLTISPVSFLVDLRLPSLSEPVKDQLRLFIRKVRKLRLKGTLTSIIVRSNLKTFTTSGFLVTEQSLTGVYNSMNGSKQTRILQLIVELSSRYVCPRHIRIDRIQRDTLRRQSLAPGAYQPRHRVFRGCIYWQCGAAIYTTHRTSHNHCLN